MGPAKRFHFHNSLSTTPPSLVLSKNTAFSFLFYQCPFHSENIVLDYILQVGPIPVQDGVGKEVVTEITTNIASNKTFYTDSNGRDFIKRVCKNHYFEKATSLSHVLFDFLQLKWTK